MPRLIAQVTKATVALALYPALCGFVLLSANEATLPVTPESPELTFVWDGKAPSIDDKGDFRDGAYADLDDQAFMQQLLTEALAIWNEVPAAFVTLSMAEEMTDGEAKLDADDNVFSIVTEKSDNLTSAAYALPEIKDDDLDTIADCDIAIADTSAAARDLAYTIAHELGHCLGLGHAHTNYNAMMGYSRSARGLKLGADDVAGLVYLYPDPDYVPDEPRELVCGSIGGLPTDAEWPWQTMALLAISLLLPLAVAASKIAVGASTLSKSSPLSRE